MKISELQNKYKNGQLTVQDHARGLLKKIKDNKLNSFITIDEESLLENAKALDKKMEKGQELGPLFGVSFAIKDNILTKGLRTTAASRGLEDFLPVYDATVIEKLKAADALIVGKTNMDEFAMGGSSETSYFGNTINPFNPDMIPGGSSSGSAAAVAGDEVVISLGTDTGGSVRNPANYCNVIGFAPSYGAISRYGVISMANSFDRVGIIGKNVEDIKRVFEVAAGLDEMDFTSIELEKKDEIKSIKGLKIAYAKLTDSYQVDEQVKKNYDKTIQHLKDQGAILEEVHVHLLSRINQVYTILMSVEVASNMSRVDGIRYGTSVTDVKDVVDLYKTNRTKNFGEEIKRRISLGNFFSSNENDQIYYKKAMQVRQLLKDMFDKILSENDFFISPTNTQLPYEVGSRLDDANAAYDSGMFNTITNIINLPSISLPVEKDYLGSVQIIGKRNSDYELLDLAELLERSLN
ncbi:MAG: Asp-tRNA(Asn)/Glu-tRNA(Gln) amidotransferase subunit GatA [Tissierellia bacterium]|nr:Asp-tRNA(Asn)/Glu-tRNA(Gln) amidotransferase subunit GatA [Tissierellia bacterium]